MNKPIQKGNGQLNRNGGTSLEPHSQINDSSESIQILEGQLRECFGRVVYSHKTHEKCADILLKRLSRMLKLWQIGVVCAMTAGGGISSAFRCGNSRFNYW